MEGWLSQAKEIQSTSLKRKPDQENQAPSETPVDLAMPKNKKAKFPSPQSVPMDLTTKPVAETDWGKKTHI